MDNSGNIVTLGAYDKLNNIIKRTYQCVTNKKKKKKLLHNTKMGQLEEGLDTYKYSDYPESGISPQQHAPPPAAATAPATGGVPLLAPAPAGPVLAAALPGPLPFAAAALPANAAEFALPAGWPDLYPLPPDSSDDSATDKFFDTASTCSAHHGAAALGEDGIWLGGQGTQDNNPDHLEEDPGDHQPFPPGYSPLFRGFPTPPRRVPFSPNLQYFEEEELKVEEAEQQPFGGQHGTHAGAGEIGGGLTETHPVDPACSSIEEQAFYYDALLAEVDKYTEEADHTLQALQGASPHLQLQQQNEI